MKNIKEQNGYSLLEMMVAIGLFSFVLLMVLNIFQVIMASQRNTISSQNIQENMAYALEVMSKEIRQANKSWDHCNNTTLLSTAFQAIAPGVSTPYTINAGVGYTVYNTSTVNGINVFYFQKKENNENYCVYYLILNNQLAIIRLKESGLLIASADYITPNEIKIDNMDFIINDFSNTGTGGRWPYVTMVIKAENVKGDKQPTYFQTSISSRAYGG